MRLAELQAAFHALATGAADPRVAETFLVGTPELGAAERIGIYADMYLVRQVEALRESFPATAAVVEAAGGADGFFALVSAYVAAHPSESPDLSHLGRRLAPFLRAHPEHAPRPDLPDLAALEWARSEAFFEAAIPSVGREALAALAPESFAAARLRFVTPLRLVRFERDPVALWRAADAGAPLPPPAAAARGTAAVWRPVLDVVHASLPPDEAEALARALSGAPIAEVCEAFAAREAPVEEAFAALASWLDEGWVAAVEGPAA